MTNAMGHTMDAALLATVLVGALRVLSLEVGDRLMFVTEGMLEREAAGMASPRS
jgi:hypothetical protein